MAPTDSTPNDFPRPFGKYVLLGRLGDGGMAEVFRAALPGPAGFRKTVVIKRILPHLARKRHFIEMFVAEANLAAEVRHRNVVQVYDLGQVGNEVFMAMEYVEGTDLRVLLGQAAKRGLRIPSWFSVHVVCEVLEALAFAWALEDEAGRPRRIVHRDVTPSNIFVSNQGEVKLGDFGVAKDATQESRTRAGQLKGKLAYMAPEQLYSRPPDHRVDVFAAGVVLWEALAQRRLFGGRPDIEVMNAITQGERAPPSRHAGDVPVELDDIVLSAVEPDLERRTQSAVAMQHGLLEVLALMRPMVRSADVRQVVSGLLGQIDPQEAGLEPLQAARGRIAAPRTSTQVSFNPSEESVEVDIPSPSAFSRGTSTTRARLDVPKNPLVDDLEMAPLVASKPTQAELPWGGSGPSGVVLGSPTDRERNRAGLLSQSGVFQAPTADPDVDALVLDAVSMVEGPARGSNLVPKEHLIAGLDQRRLLDNSRQLRSERWSFILDQEVYDGEHPFWIRDHEGTEIGPCSLEQTLQILKVECQTGVSSSTELGAERGRWCAAEGFLQLSGMESLAADPPSFGSARGSWGGSASEHGIGSVFAALTRAGANGLLLLEVDRGESYRVVEVAGGRPTFVRAPGEAMQIPQLLAAKRLVHPRQLPGLLHQVLRTQSPLGRVLERTAGLDLAKYVPMLMRERLAAAFLDGYTRFAFEARTVPSSLGAFAPSLLAMVAQLASRVPASRVETRVGLLSNAPLEPVRDFDQMLDAMALKQEERKMAERIAQGRRIGRMLDGATPSQARVIRTLAYVLLEAELLRPA